MHDDQTLQEHFNTSNLKEINNKSSQEAEWLGCNDLCLGVGWVVRQMFEPYPFPFVSNAGSSKFKLSFFAKA